MPPCGWPLHSLLLSGQRPGWRDKAAAHSAWNTFKDVNFLYLLCELGSVFKTNMIASMWAEADSICYCPRKLQQPEMVWPRNLATRGFCDEQKLQLFKFCYSVTSNISGMYTGGSFSGDKAAGAWSWPLTSS